MTKALISVEERAQTERRCCGRAIRIEESCGADWFVCISLLREKLSHDFESYLSYVSQQV